MPSDPRQLIPYLAASYKHVALLLQRRPHASKS
jgi:hypothetical protein